MTSKRERKQQRKALLARHQRPRRRRARVLLAVGAVVLVGLVTIAAVSGAGSRPAPPAWLVVGTGATTLALGGLLVAGRGTTDPWRRRAELRSAVAVVVLGAGILVAQGLASWGSGDSGEIAALVVAVFLVPTALVLVLRSFARPGRSQPGYSTASDMTDVMNVLD